MAFFIECSSVCRRSRVRFPAVTQHSQLLYAKDVEIDGSGQASTNSQSTYFPRDGTGLMCLPTQLECTLHFYFYFYFYAVRPPTSPARANFTLMTECTPESSGCNSVYSVDQTAEYYVFKCRLFSAVALSKINMWLLLYCHLAKNQRGKKYCLKCRLFFTIALWEDDS
jgi:hypothetical protein